MALKYRKGFVQTLEAVLASTLVLGVVLNVVPEFQQESNTQPRQQVLSGLETLDKTGKLNNNLVAANIESEIKPYVPKGYNYSANIVEVESASGRISGSEERYIDTDGNYSEIQLWIDSSSSLNISFNGDTILQNYSEQGYEIIQVPSSKGWLNFTGTNSLDYSFQTYSSNRETIDQDRVSVANYIVESNGTKEIQVRLWS